MNRIVCVDNQKVQNQSGKLPVLVHQNTKQGSYMRAMKVPHNPSEKAGTIKRGFFLTAMILVTPLIVVGCGGGSGAQTELERVESEYKAADAKAEALSAKVEKKSNEYLRASEAAGKLNESQLNSITSGNMAQYRRDEAATEAARAYSERLYQETEALRDLPEAAEKREELLANKIESLKGCDKTCQAERDEAINLSVHCETTMAGAGVSARQAIEICHKRYPIPRENILHLAKQ
jgi:plasmid stabilization system protein ParE